MGFYSCDYVEDRGGFFSHVYVCRLTMKEISSDTASRICLTGQYTNCYDYKSHNRFWFITNAAYKALGKEDSEDLEEFAAFKCRYICSNAEGKEFLRDYMQYGPVIAEAITANPKCTEIFQDLYEKTLLPCLERIRAGDDEGAFQMYRDMYLELKTIFI